MTRSRSGLSRIGFLSAALLVTAAVSPVLAQGRLELGRSASGDLGDGDAVLIEDGSYYDTWTYRGRSGETIKVTLRSDDFDAYLSIGRMVGGEFEGIESDDDGDGGTNSRIVMTLESDGEYVVRVNSLEGGETGRYQVMVEQGDPNEVVARHDEEGGAVASALPEPTTIQAGQTLSGELSDTDAIMSDSSHYDLYAFRARRGQQVTVTMRSDAFDSYLAVGRIEDGSLTVLESDDDSGGNEDAQVSLRITRDGQYAFRANSLFKGVTGPYTVRLETAAAPPPQPVTKTPIRMGQTVTGELTSSDPELDDNSHYDLWSFNGRRGDRVTITMKSASFDTYLVLGRMVEGEFERITADDDGGGGTDSQITATLDANGEYVIRANAVFSAARGEYTLRLERGR